MIYNDLKDRKSTSGHFFKVYGNIISWTSIQQPPVALSTTEAEYMALSSACSEVMWLRNIITDMDIELQEQVIIHEDNISAILISKNPENHKRIKQWYWGGVLFVIVVF